MHSTSRGSILKKNNRNVPAVRNILEPFLVHDIGIPISKMAVVIVLSIIMKHDLSDLF